MKKCKMILINNLNIFNKNFRILFSENMKIFKNQLPNTPNPIFSHASRSFLSKNHKIKDPKNSINTINWFNSLNYSLNKSSSTYMKIIINQNVEYKKNCVWQFSMLKTHTMRSKISQHYNNNHFYINFPFYARFWYQLTSNTHIRVDRDGKKKFFPFIQIFPTQTALRLVRRTTMCTYAYYYILSMFIHSANFMCQPFEPHEIFFAAASAPFPLWLSM